MADHEYEAPLLDVVGSVSDLTLIDGSGGEDDGDDDS